MNRKIIKVLLTFLCILTISVCFSLISFADGESGEQITVEFYSSHHLDTGAKVIKTETITIGGTVTMPTQGTPQEGCTLVWFTADGVTYDEGTTATFRENTKLYQRLAYNTSTYDDFCTHISSGESIYLTANLTGNKATSQLWSSFVFIFMNGKNVDITTNGNAINGQRAGTFFFGNGIITFNCTSGSPSTCCFRELKSHSYGGSANRLQIGKKVTLNAPTVNLACDWDGAVTTNYPEIKIYGTVNVYSILRITNSANRTPNIYIYDGAKVSINGTRLAYDTNKKNIFKVIVTGGEIALPECASEDDFWYDTVPDNYTYTITGGLFSRQLLTSLLTEDGYTQIQQSNGSYLVTSDCTSESGHEYELVETKNAGCLYSGVIIEECKYCGARSRETIPALGHAYDNTPVISGASPTTIGTAKFLCTRDASLCAQDRGAIVKKVYPSIETISVKVTVLVDGTEKEITANATDVFDCDYTELSINTDYSCALKGIKEFSDPDNSETKYTAANVTAIEIPLGVASINANNNLFKENKVIKKVDLSGAISCVIETQAFMSASNLTDIVFGTNQDYGKEAFRECTSLTKIEIGEDKVVSFGDNCFWNCEQLAELIFKDSAEITFGSNSFDNTDGRLSGLTRITFSENGTYYFYKNCFNNTNIERIVFPDGSNVYFKGEAAFYGSQKLSYVYFGKGITEISNKPFDCVYGLQTLILTDVEKVSTNYTFCVGSETGSDTDVLRVYIYSKSISLPSYAFHKRSGIIIYSNAPITNSGAFSDCNATTKTIDGESVSYPKYTIYYGIPCPVEQVTIPATCSSEGYTTYQYNHPYGDKELVTYDENNEFVYKIFEGALTNGTAKETLTLSKTDVTDILPHTLGTISSLTYANGFDAKGEKNCVCSVCSQNYTEETDVIFTVNGFAILTEGEVYISFGVNHDAFNLYNQVNATESNPSLRYGVFVSNGNIEFASDGSISEGTKAIWAEINPESEFTKFGLTVSGLQQAHENDPLAYAAYAIDFDNSLDIIQKDGITYDGTVTATAGSENQIIVNTIKYSTISTAETPEPQAALVDRKYLNILCA